MASRTRRTRSSNKSEKEPLPSPETISSEAPPSTLPDIPPPAEVGLGDKRFSGLGPSTKSVQVQSPRKIPWWRVCAWMCSLALLHFVQISLLEPARQSLKFLIERQLLELDLDRSIFIAGFCYFGELCILVSEALVAVFISFFASLKVPRRLLLIWMPFLSCSFLYILILLDLTSNPRPHLALEKRWPGSIVDLLVLCVTMAWCSQL